MEEFKNFNWELEYVENLSTLLHIQQMIDVGVSCALHKS